MSTQSVAKSFNKAKRRAEQINLGSTAAYKLLGLALGLVANLGAVAVLTNKFGISEYASYALIASMLYLLPFADLGLGAGVVNAVSDAAGGTRSQKQAAHVVARCQAILSIVAMTLTMLTGIAILTEALPCLLGAIGSFTPAVKASAITLAVFAMTLPMGVGSRILQGMGRVNLNVKLGLINPTSNIALLATGVLINASVEYFLLVPCVSYFLVNIATYLVAHKVSALPKVGAISSCKSGATQNFPIAKTALPFFVISTGMALGFQSHRLLIANLGTAQDVAAYSLVAQFAGPISAVLITVGQNLWSNYRVGGKLNNQKSMFIGDVGLFAALGVLCMLSLVTCVVLAQMILVSEAIKISPILLISATCYIFVLSLHQPGAMFLTDPNGLVRQAILLLIVSFSTLAGIYLLYSHLAEAAAYLVYSCSVFFIQVVPTWYLVMKRIKANTEHQRVVI